jgi:hypothetical protein
MGRRGPSWKPLAKTRSMPPLDPRMRPKLAPHVRVERKLGVVTRVDLGWRVEAFERERGERAAAILRRADGKRTLGDLTVGSGWSLDDTNAAAQDLYHLAVVHDAGDALAPALSFQRYIVNLGRRRMHQLRSPVGLMSYLCSGKASRRLLIGWLVESYHFVSAAASHMSPAIVVAPSERLQMLFSEYLSEEFSHGRWVRGGLREAGLTDAELDGSSPLPATLGSINLLRWTAQTNLFAYAACIGITEASGEDEGVVRGWRRTWNRLAALGLVPRKALAPFRDHLFEDLKSGHSSLCAEVFAEGAALTKPQQGAIYDAVLGFVHSRVEADRAILRFYRPAEGPLCFHHE